MTEDGAGAAQADTLDAAVGEDLSAGLIPSFVTATIGTTSTGTVDAVPAIAAVCKKHGIWCVRSHIHYFQINLSIHCCLGSLQYCRSGFFSGLRLLGMKPPKSHRVLLVVPHCWVCPMTPGKPRDVCFAGCT